MTFRALWLACTALTSLAISTTSYATNWTGANSTDWFTQGNWTFGVPNVAAPADLVTMTPNPTVIAGNAAFAASTRISFGLPASLTITGPTASLTTTFGTAVGFIGTGSLAVVNGAQLTDQRDSVVGTLRGTGNATISGAGSTWAVSNSLLVGTFDATGTLTVSNGGGITSATARLGIVGAIGTATVTGAGSRWSTTGAWELGNVGTGSLNVLSGGTASGGSFAVLGTNAGALGRVTVDGSGSSWTNTGIIEVGRDGIGILTLANGGTASAGAIWVANTATPSSNTPGTINIGSSDGVAPVAPGTLNTPSVVLVNNRARLLLNHTSTAYTLAPNITGAGLVEARNGTTILTGTASNVGVLVTGGTLLVNGANIGAFAVTGGTLGGSGTIGATTMTGGTLSPGNSIGTLGVQGNLSLSAATTYMVEVDPNGADRTNVAGTATLGGARVSATYANGSYVTRRHIIVNATGGVSGTFSSLVNTNLPANFTPSLAYDANNVFLDLTLNFTPPSAPNFDDKLNSNQRNVGNALVNSFNAAGGIPLAFGALNAQGLTIVAGEAATGSQQATFDAMGQFTDMLTDPYMRTRSTTQGTSATGYAEEDEALAYAAKRKGRNPAEQDAYAAMARKAPPRATFERRWSVWGGGFGGTQSTKGNAVVGSTNTTSRIFGGVAGFDYRVTPNTLIGFAMGGGGSNFGLANGLGGGRSDLFQVGLYGCHEFDGGVYIAGSLAYGFQDVTTDRNVFLNQYRANFDASALSGRLETGYRIGVGSSAAIVPYAAGRFVTFWLPSYGEQVVAGTNIFALNYQSRDVTSSRTELGLRGETSFASSDAVITLRGRAAWAHNFDTARGISASFLSLPASGFVVNGAAPAREAALASAGAEMRWANGFSVAGTFEGEFSRVTESYGGKGTLRYQW